MKPRYLVLSGNVLAWYESEETTKPKSSMSLIGSTAAAAVAVSSARSSNTERFGFTVTISAPAPREAYFEANTEAERDTWLRMLHIAG